MPIPVLRACVAVFGFAFASLLFASVAEAKSIPADLRVVDSEGAVLADQTQYTSTDAVRVKSDKRADCFGPDTGGSGEKVDVPGSTALAQLADGGRTDRDLRPLSISDNFDFGLALCGIGEAVSTQSGFFYLKVDHVDAQLGGDQTVVKKRDSVLWYLVEDFNDPVPDELALSTSGQAKSGEELTVKVVSYGVDGTKSAAEGAEVTGADAPTDARGKTTVTVEDLSELTATRDGSIPSNEVVVCGLKAAKCPAGYAETIGGTGGADKIATGKGAETILAGGGDDTIKGDGSSAPDLVKCGGGDDKVTGYGKSNEVTKFAGCEKVS